MGDTAGGTALERAEPALREVLQEADATPWADLRARASAARAAWAAAAAGLPPGGFPATGDGWSAAEVCSHVAARLRAAVDALATVAVAGEARVGGGDRFLPGEPDLGRALETIDRWWPQLQMTLVTLPKLPDPGPVIDSPLGTLTPRQGVLLLLRHLEEHAAQLDARPEGGPGHDH